MFCMITVIFTLIILTLIAALTVLIFSIVKMFRK